MNGDAMMLLDDAALRKVVRTRTSSRAFPEAKRIIKACKRRVCGGHDR